MRYLNIDDKKALDNFVEKATTWFKEHPESTTFGDVQVGTYFAVRWGLVGYSMMVFKLSSEFEPIVYGDALRYDV